MDDRDSVTPTHPGTSEGSDPSPGATSGERRGVVSADPPEADPPAGPDVSSFLSWPPPGLGRLQGDLWQVTRLTAIGGVLLVLPLLWAAATRQEFWSLGPFGSSWWVILLTSGVGLAILVTAFVDLFRLVRRAARSTSRGYGWVTVAAVAVDQKRDGGFLLQGARAYSVLSPGQRRRLVQARLYGAAAFFAGVLWLPVGFALGVLLATRGTLTPGGLTLFTLLPAGLFVLVGVGMRTWDSRVVRGAKRRWFQQPWSRDLARDEVRSWNEAFEARREDPVPGAGAIPGRGMLQGAAAAVLAVALLVFVPALTLVFATALGPLVASVSVPDFSATQRRAATVEAYRAFVVEPDPGLSPQEAGDILHDLTFAGTGREVLPLERPPGTRYAEPWLPDLRGGPTGIFPARWSGELMARAGDGLSEAEAAFLRNVDDHPALAEFRRLAQAEAVDVGAGRWTLPFPEGTTVLELPLPEMSGIRQASWAMVGSAALATAEGRLDDAERTLREVVSVGFLLGDDAPTVVENLIGYVLVNTGGEALENFYATTGRTGEAEALARTRLATGRTSEMSRVGAGSDLEGSLRQIPSVVENPRGIRGLRWSYFVSMSTLAPCLNTQKMVFGPGDEYEEWVARAEENLVRWDSEEALFELARNGMFVGKGEEGADGGVLSAVLGLTLGGEGQRGSCASFVQDAQWGTD